MINNSFERYFTFWFAHFANGLDRNRIYLDEKDYYIRTKEVAMKHGPIIEDSRLKDKVERIFSQLTNDNFSN